VFTNDLQTLQYQHCDPAVPFAMYAAFPRSDYYEDSAPPRADSRRWTCRRRPGWAEGGQPGMVPTFTMSRSAG